MKTTWILFVILILLSGCGQTLHIPYKPNSGNTGTIHLRPTEVTSQTLVTINDQLIVSKGYVKSITVTDIPEGEHEIYYTSNSTYYKEKIEGKFTVRIPDDNEETRIVQVPGYSNGYWALVGILAVILFVPILVVL